MPNGSVVLLCNFCAVVYTWVQYNQNDHTQEADSMMLLIWGSLLIINLLFYFRKIKHPTPSPIHKESSSILAVQKKITSQKRTSSPVPQPELPTQSNDDLDDKEIEDLPPLKAKENKEESITIRIPTFSNSTALPLLSSPLSSLKLKRKYTASHRISSGQKSIDLSLSTHSESVSALPVLLTIYNRQRITHWPGLAYTGKIDQSPFYSRSSLHPKNIDLEQLNTWLNTQGIPAQRFDLIRLLTSARLRLPEVWELQVLKAMDVLSSDAFLWTRDQRDLMWCPQQGTWVAPSLHTPLQLVAFWIAEGDCEIHPHDEYQVADASEWLNRLSATLLAQTSFGIEDLMDDFLG